MKTQVLVAYASRYGATAEIAGKIGQILRQEGLQTDVLAVNKVKDLAPYQAVVLGSAVYIGWWRKEASRFLKANAPILANKMVWLFSSGPTGKGDPLMLTRRWLLPKKLKIIAERIAVRDIALFHGALDESKLNFIEKWMIKKVKAPYGDYRDWNAISSWALKIARDIKEAELPTQIKSALLDSPLFPQPH